MPKKGYMDLYGRSLQSKYWNPTDMAIYQL